jgi:hypothetical protein
MVNYNHHGYANHSNKHLAIDQTSTQSPTFNQGLHIPRYIALVWVSGSTYPACLQKASWATRRAKANTKPRWDKNEGQKEGKKRMNQFSGRLGQKTTNTWWNMFNKINSVELAKLARTNIRIQYKASCLNCLHNPLQPSVYLQHTVHHAIGMEQPGPIQEKLVGLQAHETIDPAPSHVYKELKSGPLNDSEKMIYLGYKVVPHS